MFKFCKKLHLKNNRSGQNMIEYVLAFVAVVIILVGTLGPGGFLSNKIDQSLNSAITGAQCMTNAICYDPAGCPPVAGTCLGCARNSDCDDGDVCTGIETCSSGVCIPGTALFCDDSDACTADSCNQVSGCQNVLVNCDDSNACTTDSCDTALGCQNIAIGCDDSNACTTDSCNPVSGCQNIPTICDDSDVCTTDSCDIALGCQNAPISCDDGIACTIDSCDAVLGCQNIPTICSGCAGCPAGSFTVSPITYCTTPLGQTGEWRWVGATTWTPGTPHPRCRVSITNTEWRFF